MTTTRTGNNTDVLADISSTAFMSPNIDVANPEFQDACKGVNNLLPHFTNQLKYAADVFNGMSAAALSPLFLMTAYKKGLEALLSDEDLYTQITPQGLNKILVVGTEIGKSPLFNMALNIKNENISNLLLYNKKLIEKITPDALNKVIQSGPFKGTSPAFWLLYSDEGLRLLTAYPHICDMINEEALNCILPIGTSAVYYLARSKTGIEFLFNHPSLINKINNVAINHPVPAGEEEGISPLLLIASQAEGLFLLSHYPLLDHANLVGLNTFVKHGDYAGTSAFYWLARTEAGRVNLLGTSLCNLVSKGTLYAPPKNKALGEAPIYYLFNTPTGQRIVSRSRRLRDLQEEEAEKYGDNQRQQTCINQDASVAAVYSDTRSEVKLNNYPSFFSKNAAERDEELRKTSSHHHKGARLKESIKNFFK